MPARGPGAGGAPSRAAGGARTRDPISAEAEHREILREVLLVRPAGKTLKEMLAAVPDVGDDADVERAPDTGRGPSL